MTTMRTYSFNHVVQRLKMSDHTIRVVVVEVETRSFLETFEPLLVPQDSDANELSTDNKGLTKSQQRGD